jgi:hypothetical protein
MFARATHDPQLGDIPLIPLRNYYVRHKKRTSGYSFDMLSPLEPQTNDAIEDFRTFVAGRRFGAILADPPWQFQNRTGKVAPEHRRLNRYSTIN